MKERSVVFIWENFGPLHLDRCEAAAALLSPSWTARGIELANKSVEYKWASSEESGFEKITLFRGKSIAQVSFWQRTWATLRACWRVRPAAYFFCDYQEISTLVCAMVLRCCGSQVFVMNDSKFDDYQRHFFREMVKKIFYFPYNGALTSGIRARDYLRFLGFPESKIQLNYDALSIERVRRLGAAPPAPNGLQHKDRHFTIVARFVPKKNLSMALDAYSLYCASVASPRPLHLCGSGPLEPDLRKKVNDLALGDSVVFHGFVQTEGVCRILASTLALLLPSLEEQFGNVVIEAQAMGVPVILSNNCGACDLLVRSGVNGFVIEPDNPQGMAFFMALLCEDERLWHKMCLSNKFFVEQGDVGRFVEAVANLLGATLSSRPEDVGRFVGSASLTSQV
jgi:glycosyltransferase involved in cell wall biosynthesis